MADRATIRVAVPQGWARGVLAGIEAAFAGWALITVVTMIAYLTLRSNSWMNDTTPRDALGLGGDLWAAVIGGTSVVGGVHYRAIPTLVGALLIVLVRLLLRNTAGFPRSAALFAVPGFLLTSWLLAGASGIYSPWWTGMLGAILIPLIGSVRKLQIARDRAEKVLATVSAESGYELNFPIGCMIELPRAAVSADTIAEEADFFSFGTNDLTQTTWGFSRDDVESSFVGRYIDDGIFGSSPFESIDVDGVGSMVRLGVEGGRETRPGMKVGVCGEHGGDPESILFFHEAGLDYVSCSPFRVPVARLEAGRAAVLSPVE